MVNQPATLAAAPAAFTYITLSEAINATLATFAATTAGPVITRPVMKAPRRPPNPTAAHIFLQFLLF